MLRRELVWKRRVQGWKVKEVGFEKDALLAMSQEDISQEDIDYYRYYIVPLGDDEEDCIPLSINLLYSESFRL